jgi:hypothetical protein
MVLADLSIRDVTTEGAMSFRDNLTLIVVVSLLLVGSEKALAEKPFEHGTYWKALSDVERVLYVQGYLDCARTIKSTLAFMRKQGDSFSERGYNTISRFIGTDFSPESIRNVMDYIYKDPANTILPFYHVLSFAQRKLKGDDIENDLRFQRKLEYHIYGMTEGNKESKEFFESNEFKEHFGGKKPEKTIDIKELQPLQPE